MNEEDMINSIGTIAKSGTKSFVEALTGDAKRFKLKNWSIWGWILFCIYGLQKK